MKYRYIAMILITAILLSALSFVNYAYAETPSFQSLGNITECTIDEKSNLIHIQGSIKHSILIDNRDAKIAVYRFDPWANIVSAITSAEPEAITEMSITFEFELPCSTVLHKSSLYAVALIDSNGNTSLISAPTYPDATSKDTSDAGFKAILTPDHAAALPTLPGSAIVDVFLDKLNNGNNSGYIYNANGDLFYFDKPTVNGLDKIIRSYTATGTKVYMRFLVSPNVTDLPFCSDAATWAANKCVVVDNEDALMAIYAYTAFLTSRYSGADFGKVDGIILGRGADMPVLNNYAFLVSEDYNTVYARSLTLIGLAASQASDNKISLLVPIGDELTSNYRVNGEEFLYAVADYVDTYSDLTFTILCESRHNPYGITDEMFSSVIEPEITVDDIEGDEKYEYEGTQPSDYESVTVEATDEVTSPPPEVEESTASTEHTDSPVTTTEDTTALMVSEETETESSPEETTYQNPLTPNTNSGGFFCTDNIEVFKQMLERLSKIHTSVNKGFAWCWYPNADTAESALGVCYSYNYMKLASVGADFYAVGFENDLVERFPSVAHLLKYVDTSENVKETAYARTVFGIDSWEELINKWTDGCGVRSSFVENELMPNITDYSGELVYLDYSTGKGSVSWYNGYYCGDLLLQNTDGQGYLKASMETDAIGFTPAEIGYVLSRPEPLLVGDALTFDIQCGESDGSIYEITVYVNHGEGTLISKAVVAGGIRCSLSADVSEYDSTVLVNSIRISVKRVTGDGAFDLKLYNVKINDYSAGSALLAQKLEDVRNYLRTDTRTNNSSNKTGIIFGVASLTAIGIALTLWAYGNDRKNKSSDS